MDSIRFVKRSRVDARCREGTRGAGFLNPITIDTAHVRDARRWRRRCMIGGAASRRFFGGLFSPPRRARRNGRACERKRPIRRRVASRGTRVDRSIARARVRSVEWWCSVDRRRRRRRGGGGGVCSSSARTDGRAGVGRASSRVESMDGTNANANASRTRGDAGRRPRATPFRIARVIDLID